MKDFILGAALGYLTARYFILSMDKQDYLKKESETVDKIKNQVHDLVHEIAPQLTTEEIAAKVENATTVNSGAKTQIL